MMGTSAWATLKASYALVCDIIMCALSVTCILSVHCGDECFCCTEYLDNFEKNKATEMVR